MAKARADRAADPLIWGEGERLFEMFLEPTCPFSARAFGKIDRLLDHVPHGSLRVRIWLHSQPWHMFSGVICRTIFAASTLPGGRDDAKALMKAIYARREDFEFDDHRAGPNLETTPNALIARMEEASGLALADAFQLPGLDAEVRRHTKYARQNGIHVSPTFMVDGLIDGEISSGGAVADWAGRILG